MNYLDLFAGIGGFSKGLQNAGVKFNNHFFSEIDKNAISIYQKHFPNAIGVGDVSTIRDFSQFGKIDLITFGSPCQDLSIAGKRRGLAGSRSGLFFEAMRLIRELKPTYFIFENVKGIFSSDRGADFIRCLREIADLGGYDCEWQLVNTIWLLPQNRERVYFIGHLRGKSSPKVFPFLDSDFDASGISGQQAKCLTTQGTHTIGTYVVERQFNEKIGKTLTTQSQGLAWYDGVAIRRLTPLEWERLQGFPDGWTDIEVSYRRGNIKRMADSARYKALGNAVSVPIVTMIAKRLLS